MLKRIVFCYASVLATAFLAGCANNEFSGNRYDSANAGEVARTDEGTIVSLRRVSIKPDGSTEATALGAVGGGLVGSMFGKGGGKLLTTTAGAVAGGVAGNALTSRETEGVEYSVKLGTGAMVTIAQSPEPALSVGQRVFVVNSSKGRSRVVPAA
jgi:outer membrane lipoprotein SlyB